uniref:LIM domain-containing protein n=1 Tax=Rhabditophanes sp. KR3021 TaxID=114890 RepID=A0AC35U8A6_9BILA
MVARLSEADKKEIIGEDQIKMLRETVLRETRPKNATLSSSAVKSDQIRQYIKEQDLKSQNQYSFPNHTKSSLSINVNSNLNGHTKYNGGQINGIIKDSNGNAPSPSSTLSTENGRWSNASSTSSSLNSSQTKSKEDDYISPQAKFYFHGDDYGKDGSGEFDVRHQQVPIKTILNEGPPKDSLYSKPWKKVEFNLPPKQTPQERRLPRVDPDAVYERPPPHMTQPNRDRYVIGDCGKCSLPIFNTESNTFALEQLFHTTCFTCTTCSLPLKGKQFYTLKDKCYCEADYLKESARESVKCHECGHNITDVVISALGKSFCPECFRCSRCRVLLDGQPFTVDKKGDIYCKQDYHDLFSPKCARCHEPIVSDNEVTEFIRVPNLNNQDYHIQCYTCECCHKNLKSDSEKKCYPIGNVILCLTCNKIWARTGGTNTPITDL